MPVIRFHVDDLTRLLGRDVPHAKLAETIPMIGADLDDVSGDEWAVEFFPDRPDLFTVEGIARALRTFLDIESGLAEYEVTAAKHDLAVEATVKDVRPFIAGAFVRDVPMTERLLDGLIALQEDLHWGLGARRRKVAIGIHDAKDLVPPFVYKGAAPDEVRFVPLQKTEEMDLAEVLEKHEKGREYAHLVAGHDRYPVILDAKGQVLSFPPVINGRLTTVMATSRDLFLDVTGTDKRAVTRALNILATTLAEAGGRLEAVTLTGEGGGAVTPDLTPTRRDLPVADVAGLVGVDLTGDDVAAALRRMGFGAEGDGDLVHVDVPAWRSDVLHDVDLMEDVAIGHGYDRIPHRGLAAVTTGRALDGATVAERARQALVGQGFLEVMTLNLTNPRDQFTRMGVAEDDGRAVRVRNPSTVEHTLLRTRLVPSLLAVLAKNTHRDLPQRVFEVGVATVVDDEGRARPERRVAGVVVASRVGFSDVKGIVLSLARDLGWAAKVAAAADPAFVPGRVARLAEGGGVFGELAPATITAFGLGYPAVAFEFALPPHPPSEGGT